MEYKDDIKNTRTGCVGGSDGKMLSQIASLGTIPSSAKKRLAVVKGLIENEEIPYTAAVRTGDEIEMAIFEHLQANGGDYQSNPYIESKTYSKKNVKLIAHPDIVRKDEKSKTLFIYEVKATRYSVEETYTTYRSQLYIEYILGKELLNTLGKGWKLKLALVHYSTEGLDLENGVEFDPSRLTIRPVRFNVAVFDIEKAMTTIDTFLETYDTYSEDDVVEAKYLPAEVRSKFEAVANTLREIKEREAEVDEFKKKLYNFLSAKGIKKVACDDFSFTVVEPTQQVTFDAKKFMEDMTAEHPRKAKRIKEKYKKTTNKRGFVTIKTRDNNE